nr:hypothetical protein [Burkholderia cenocepacia]
MFSCEPLTASVLEADSVPAATFVSATGDAAVVPPSVTDVWPVLSYWTALAVAPATALSWPTLTASVVAVPAATPESVRAPFVPVKSTDMPPVCAPTAIGPLPGAPPVC